MSAASTKTAKGAHSEFAAFVSDAGVTESLVPILAERGWPIDCVNNGGIEMAIRVLGASASPAVLLVDLSNSADARGDINALAEVCEPGTAVIAVGTQNDVRFYRDLLDTGILDYFVKPVAPDEIRLALFNAEQAQRAPEEPAATGDAAAHRVIAVIGARGGVGTSLIAASSAWIMANELGHSVALLDLDIHFGVGALAFDLEPGRGLIDALDNPNRVDSLFVERAVIKESDKLSILSAEASLNDAVHADPAALSHLLAEIKHGYHVTMIDLPRHVATQHPFLLGETTDIVLISDMTLAATRDTIRLLSFLKATAPQATVRIVLNRLGLNGLVEVEQKDFEAAIERKIDWIVPNDPKSVVLAAKRGKTLPETANAAKLTQSLRTLSEAMVGAKEKTVEEPFWKRIVAMGKK